MCIMCIVKPAALVGTVLIGTVMVLACPRRLRGGRRGDCPLASIAFDKTLRI